MTNYWGTFCVNRFDSFCFTYRMESNIFQSMPPKPQSMVNVHQIIFRSFGGADDSSLSYNLFVSPVHNFSICSYFCVLFIMSGERILISCLPLIKWLLHKPIQTWATAATTTIIYSESTQQPDTSISFPAGDRENRGGYYKDHITGKVGAIFYQTLAL